MNATTEFQMAIAGNADRWVPACNGTEVPFVTRTRRTLLYCFNPRQGKHAYLDTSTDLILSDEEASQALAL
jgi:hypothetical protein